MSSQTKKIEYVETADLREKIFELLDKYPNQSHPQIVEKIKDTTPSDFYFKPRTVRYIIKTAIDNNEIDWIANLRNMKQKLYFLTKKGQKTLSN